ncbi:MAG: Acyltransferase 3 [Acidobacteria bacterium]|nr:Acyltransferase 3 [Acidobacteriota bacterium]
MPAPQQQPPTNKTPGFRLGYRPELDGVRGVSILLVLGLHFTPRLLPGGYCGVEVFFVLSGFLITSLLLQEWERTGSIRLKDFYFRRALRLGPGLLFYLLLLGGYAFVFLNSERATEIYKGILWTLSYVSNWVIALEHGHPASVLAITWSLAVEEQFYLLWPPILVLLLKRKVSRPWITFIILFAIVVIVLHRTWLWHTGASFRRLYYATDTRADGLMLGCLIACLVSWKLIPRARLFELSLTTLALLAFLFLAYLVLMIDSELYLFRWMFTLASLSIATVLLSLVVWPDSIACFLLKFPPLVWVGRISYGLYLWHWPVRGYVFGASSQPTYRQIIAALVLSFGITTISFYVVEQPFLAWKKRLSRV